MRRLLTVSTLCLAATTATPGAAFASGGYGPSAPSGPSSPPGGYSTVVLATTFDDTGGSAHTTVDHAHVTITLSKHAVTHKILIKITAPSLAGVNRGLKHLGRGGDKAVAGLGVEFLHENGRPLKSPLHKAVQITITRPTITASDRIYRIVNPKKAKRVTAHISHHTASFALASSANLAVLTAR